MDKVSGRAELAKFAASLAMLAAFVVGGLALLGPWVDARAERAAQSLVDAYFRKVDARLGADDYLRACAERPPAGAIPLMP